MNQETLSILILLATFAPIVTLAWLYHFHAPFQARLLKAPLRLRGAYRRRPKNLFSDEDGKAHVWEGGRFIPYEPKATPAHSKTSFLKFKTKNK